MHFKDNHNHYIWNVFLKIFLDSISVINNEAYAITALHPHPHYSHTHTHTHTHTYSPTILVSKLLSATSCGQGVTPQLRPIIKRLLMYLHFWLLYFFLLYVHIHKIITINIKHLKWQTNFSIFLTSVLLLLTVWQWQYAEQLVCKACTYLSLFINCWQYY